MLKKAEYLLLTLLLLLFSGTAAFAQDNTGATLEGLITETKDNYFLMDDIAYGSVQVNLDPSSTVYEGVAAAYTLAAGQYVYVAYNGSMTKSIPPQVQADKVSCFTVTGTVNAILNDGFTVDGDALLGTVIVHTSGVLSPVYQGVSITLYYNGVMALSYPPQVTAVYLSVPTLQGVVSGLISDGFKFTTDDDITYQIALSPSTDILALPAEGARLLVYYNGDRSGETVEALAITLPDDVIYPSAM